MSTSITFTDGIGATTLTNSKASPGDRFANWTPESVPVGDSAPRQSDEAITMFRTSDRYGVSFELPHIPSLGSGSPKVAMVDIADRLCYHLLNGGTCVVNTGDVDSNSYATCGLMPGTTPKVVLTDKAEIEYTLKVSLINLAGSPVRMVCRYANQ